MNEKKMSKNDHDGMSREEFLKMIGAGLFVAGLYSMNGLMAFADQQEKGKIKALVNIFGRETPVELDFLQVKKI